MSDPLALITLGLSMAILEASIQSVLQNNRNKEWANNETPPPDPFEHRAWTAGRIVVGAIGLNGIIGTEYHWSIYISSILIVVGSFGSLFNLLLNKLSNWPWHHLGSTSSVDKLVRLIGINVKSPVTLFLILTSFYLLLMLLGLVIVRYYM